MRYVVQDRSSIQTDLSLLERMGDSRYRSQAWLDFLDRYTRLFFTWFRHWGVDPASMEDVLQDTMIRILGDIHGFEHQRAGSFRNWMRTLAHNSWAQLVKDTQRQMAQRRIKAKHPAQFDNLSTKLAERHLMDLFDELATNELIDTAHSCVRRQVDPDTWETYTLVNIQNHSVEDVMASQSINSTQVYNRIYRVRKLLKEEMEKLDSPSS